eukprot:jgi/Mesvir1/18022/Mv09348-RA.5
MASSVAQVAKCDVKASVAASSAVAPKASAFMGARAKVSAAKRVSKSQKMAAVAKVDRWKLAADTSDDQQDITRGRNMVDPKFQGFGGMEGTHNAINDYYISPSFLDKLVLHISKNYIELPKIKVPLILGIWGGKGQGKSFQCELAFKMLGITPIVMSAGELESGNAGEPARLIRQRYREAADLIKKGKMSALFINDLDAGAGRMGGTTQYTVNNQLVNATLMNIADNPTNVQLPGVYNNETISRVPIICTGNDFSTLYAPLIRDGRMEKFYWAPTRADRIGVACGIFRDDGITEAEVTKIVDSFPGQSIDFFGALRSRVYDDMVRDFIAETGIQNLKSKLVNPKGGPPKFEKPRMTVEKLLAYGRAIEQEQKNVKRVQLAEEYLEGAALGEADKYDKEYMN